MRSKVLHALLLTLAISSFTAASLAATRTITKTAKNLFFCPPVNIIKKNPTKMTWAADQGNFKSYEMSFAKGLSKFLGAQWVGANVGQITCLYEASPKTSFPILLIFHTLTHQPKGGQWGKNLGGYLNCHSLKQTDCPFKMVLKKKQGNLYQEAEKLKSNNSTP